MKTTPSEHDEQTMLVRLLDIAGLRFFAVPNGGDRNRIVAAKLKAEGVRRGVPDLHIIQRPPAMPEKLGVVIEMKRRDLAPKTDRAGRWSGASVEQVDWLEHYEAQGWVALVCYGCDDALAALSDLGFNVRARIDAPRRFA